MFLMLNTAVPSNRKICMAIFEFSNTRSRSAGCPFIHPARKWTTCVFHHRNGRKSCDGTSTNNFNSDPFAKTLFYSEEPSFYTWNTTSKQFNPRKRGMAVEGHDGVFKSNTTGRVYTVHPKNAECFYLRLLLHTIRGPTCFEDLRTANGYICDTYREACQRLGLLENDNHWDLAMNEAAQTCFK